MKQLIEALLEQLLGRVPIGWLQVAHNRTRLLAAVAGVTFANVLVFMQLGFLGAMVTSIKRPYDLMNADVMISACDMNSLSDGSPIPRQRMFQALGVDDVASATPLYYAKVEWKQADGSVRNLDVFGVDPSAETFNDPTIHSLLPQLAMSDVALLDRNVRNVPKETFDAIDAGTPLTFEANGRTLNIVGTFTIGGSFSADGFMILSDQTFFKLFPQRISGAPNHIFVKLKPSAKREAAVAKLRAVLPEFDSIVRTVPEAVAKDQAFQTTQRPVGIVFGFGVVVGIFVGVVIVYQVLTTDVADHMKEYATFKAMGYEQGFFLGIIFEEATILATLGFIPGISISLGLYALLTRVTGLPIQMSAGRAGVVLVGTLAMCALSGALATRRLTRANPAELFA